MSVQPDLTACPRCGATSPLGAVGGLCPTCLARGALTPGTGWLTPRAAETRPEVPGWLITGLLGAGGMGSVYRAESEADGSPAALKVLALRWSRDPLMASRFEAEADALRQLEHPHIVRVLDFTETEDDRLCLVMELVDGCDLARLLRAERLAPERAAELFDKVCAAVAHAHERGFLHRDIKPSNILVGRDGTVKLADFGLAKDFTEDGGVSQIGGLTATTDQFGTAYYLAPERMLADKTCGPQADVFSLGVLLYHLFAGQMPVGKFTPISQLTNLPPAVDAIVSRALEADPERRTATAAELRDSFATVWSRHLSGAHRSLRVKQIAALAGTVMAAAAIGAWWQRERMRPAPPVVYPAPTAATTTQPWENSIGMKFVPVPGTNVLFSIWETRRRDFALHRADDAANFTPWREDHFERARAKSESVVIFSEGGAISKTGTWNDPGWPVTPDHAAGGISIRQAQRFCLWLTWRDQLAGRVALGWHYRLPTHAEWLAACGGENAAVHPGNVAGEEARDENWPARRATLPQRDLFPRSAPVGSFPPELHGLYDISGNVTEWVVDEDEDTSTRDGQSNAQLRGPCFIDGSPEHLRFSFLRPPFRVARLSFAGFRVVLEPPEPPREEP